MLFIMFELNNKRKMINKINLQKLVIYKIALQYKIQQQRNIRNYLFNKHMSNLNNIIDKQTSDPAIEVNTDAIDDDEIVDNDDEIVDNDDEIVDNDDEIVDNDDEIIDDSDNSNVFDYITHVEPTFDLIDVYDASYEISDNLKYFLKTT